MDLTQHPPALPMRETSSATSAKRLRRGGITTSSRIPHSNKRPNGGGILKHSASWLDAEESENSSSNASCKTSDCPSSSPFSQYFDQQVALDIVNSYKRPCIIVTHDEQMETCRLMLYDLIQFSGLLLEEKHDAHLAVEGYTLALTVVHLQTKIQDNRSVVRIAPEELLADLVTYKHHTGKLLAEMHDARVKYGVYDRAMDDAYRTACNSTHAHTHHSGCDMEPLHIKAYADYMADATECITSTILYNMSAAYSLQQLHSAALQTCQLALECTRFVPNAHCGILIKTLVLRRMHSLLVGPLCCEKNVEQSEYSKDQQHQLGWIVYASGLDTTQISEELFTYEVYMLTMYPVGASAA